MTAWIIGMSASASGKRIVADAVSRLPLPGASISDKGGRFVGMCDSNGRLPAVSAEMYPLSVRCLGYKDLTVSHPGSDTLFMTGSIFELPEVVIESRNHKLLHMLAYIREYSTLSTLNDTVFLFREKMADYMLNPERKSHFRGWINPRTLNSRSYYRFTDSNGLDSVSDNSNQHFSWSDWIGMVPPIDLPPSLRHTSSASDTLWGKYRPSEIWCRDCDRVSTVVDVLADTTSRKWVPNLATFFRKGQEFDNFKIRFQYTNVDDSGITPEALTGYSYGIESKGRGHEMFMFNRVGERINVSTYAEVYILDKEYITVKEARKWEQLKIDRDLVDFFEPDGISELQPSIISLIDRVNSIDRTGIRLAIQPDQRMKSQRVKPQTIGDRLLQMLKDATGISSYKMHRNMRRQWREAMGRDRTSD